MNLPKEFIRTIESVFDEDGKDFIKNLSSLIKTASRLWQLDSVQPVSHLSYNFVAYAGRGDSRVAPTQDVVLKIGVPRDELVSEMMALKFYDGNGACKLLEYDEEKGMLLLERLKPGNMLSELEDDDERTHIAMDVMLNLQSRGEVTSPLHENNKHIKLSDWFDELKNIRKHFSGGMGIFPKEILERVEAILPDLLNEENILLHGDFHHYNILSSERGWLVIDPKGVLGPAGYEIGPLMLNPMTKLMEWNQFEAWSKRRVDIIQERTGWDRESIINWALSHAILSTWWDVESNMNADYSLVGATIFFGLK